MRNYGTTTNFWSKMSRIAATGNHKKTRKRQKRNNGRRHDDIRVWTHPDLLNGTLKPVEVPVRPTVTFMMTGIMTSNIESMGMSKHRTQESGFRARQPHTKGQKTPRTFHQSIRALAA